ncbi:MAG: InlB B-repeat-containing protein [Anaerovoracaceae bacterium]|jgi:uncharacterized repeat protein (TIGR02543 family)
MTLPFGEAEKYSFAKGLHYKVLPASQMAVTFDSRGGTAVPTQFVLIGTPAKKPDAPTKAGYAFTGWYEKEDATGEQWDFSTKIEGNVTLYAGWKAKAPDADKAPGTAGSVKAVPKSPKTGDDSTGIALALLMMTGAVAEAVALRRQEQR